MNAGKYDFSRHCTECGRKSDTMVTESGHQANGEMVEVIKKGERLCPDCAKARGHRTLAQVNEDMKYQITYAFKEGDEVWVKLQMPYNKKPGNYPATVLRQRCPDAFEDRPRYDVQLMDGREVIGVDELLVSKEVRHG